MGAASLAIEILSPRNTAAEIERKLTLYFADGANEVWVIAPAHRSLSAYTRVENQVRRVSVRDRYDAAAFGIIVSLDTLFELDRAATVPPPLPPSRHCHFSSLV